MDRHFGIWLIFISIDCHFYLLLSPWSCKSRAWFTFYKSCLFYSLFNKFNIDLSLTSASFIICSFYQISRVSLLAILCLWWWSCNFFQKNIWRIKCSNEIFSSKSLSQTKPLNNVSFSLLWNYNEFFNLQSYFQFQHVLTNFLKYF